MTRPPPTTTKAQAAFNTTHHSSPAPGPSNQRPLEGGAAATATVPFVISRWSLRPPQREMAIDGRSLRLSEVLSMPLSTPELPTD